MRSYTPPEYLVKIDHTRCRRCGRCVQGCGFGVLSMASSIWARSAELFKESAEELKQVFARVKEYAPDQVVADSKKCVYCHWCVCGCPEGAISVEPNPLAYKPNHHWEPHHMKNIWLQAETGGMVLTGSGNDKAYFNYFDHLLLDACQVTNPSIDPLREPMELRT